MEKGKAVRDGKTERKKSNSKTAAIIFKLFIIDRRYAETNKKKCDSSFMVPVSQNSCTVLKVCGRLTCRLPQKW